MEPNQIIHQFQQLNRTRIARLSKLVLPQQQNLFTLLPFLFHTNSPDLPGYVEKDMPIGIMDYQPDDLTLHAAEKLDNHFKYKRQGIRHFGLVGLYLINSYGLLDLPEQLAFRVYLVHNDVSDEQLAALKQKCQRLSQWAQQADITLQFSLYGLSELAQHPITGEQLDQLYLNGLILGGSVPLWWLIPPDTNYDNEAEAIAQQRLQTHASIVDFGDIGDCQPEPLLTAAIETLNQHLESGLTGLLSLQYLQHCLTVFPRIPHLSEQYKAAVYEGEREPLNVDTKVLQFNTLIRQAKLTENNKTLIQQSLYILGEEALSKRISRPQYPWRRDFFKQLSQTWSWPNHQFQLLDQRDSAHFESCQQEHLQTHPVLVEICSSITNFNQQQQLDSNQAITDVKAKLAIFSDNKPNTLRPLPSGLGTKQAETEIHLYRFQPDDDWKLSLVPLESASQHGIYQHASLLQLLAWAIFNGLLTKSTRISIADKAQNTSINTVVALAQQLLRTALIEPVSITSKSDENPALDQLFLFINLEPVATTVNRPNEVQLSSLYNDPLNYADRGETLIHSVDGLFRTQTGEWQTFNHEGRLSPLKTLETLIPWWMTSRSATAVQCWCPSEPYGPLISQRMSEIYTDVNTHYLNNPYGNYLVQIANSIYQLSWQPEGYDITDLNSTHLPPLLARKATFSNTRLDTKLDKQSRYQQLLTCQQQHTLNLVIEQQGEYITAHLIDENGNLFSQSDLRLTHETTLLHFQHFLHPIQQQRSDLTVRYFELNKAQQNKYLLTPIETMAKTTKQGYLPVVVTMSSADNTARCTITCGPKIFSGQANEPLLFSQVADYILSLRKTHQSYPLYINELSFASPDIVTTLDYFKQKHSLEKQLNQR